MRRIQVAVGVIRNKGRVLVGQRIVQDKYFQKWEFPGGKLEVNETAEQALKRELHEELAILVKNLRPLIQLDHNYSDLHVRLHVYDVLDYSGEPEGSEGQEIQWVKPQDCLSLDFLEANQPIVNAVSLPKFVLITDIQTYGLSQTLAKIESIQAKYGAVQVQLRERDITMSLLQEYLQSIRPLLIEGSQLILNGEPKLAKEFGFDGVQLNRYRLNKFTDREQIDLAWVGASCHNKGELVQAEKVADFAFFSPVSLTNSHPEVQGIGWRKFQQMCMLAKLPVYALGGMSVTELDNAIQKGAQGVAILSDAWR